MPEKIDISRQEVAEHYGYSELAPMTGCWPTETGTLDRLAKLPEVLDPKKKFRVIFDYDPEFGRAFLQVIEHQTSTQGKPDGQAGDVKKSFTEVFAEQAAEYKAILAEQAKRDIDQATP